MVDVTHDDDPDEAESFDLTIRVPGVAFDIGQPGFPKVLVVQRLADAVTEYDAARDGKGQAEYLKNALVRTQPSDPVYQAVYLPDGPLGGNELKDPKTRYPVPESRLVPLRAERADPIDDSPTWTPREAVELDVLESLFDIALTDEETPLDEDALEQAAVRAGTNSDVVQSAREASEAFAEDFHDDVSVDDGDGPDMELTEVEDHPEPPAGPDDGGGEPGNYDAMDDALEGDEPPEPPEDGGPDSVEELDDDELGDFDPAPDN